MSEVGGSECDASHFGTIQTLRKGGDDDVVLKVSF